MFCTGILVTDPSGNDSLDTQTHAHSHTFTVLQCNVIRNAFGTMLQWLMGKILIYPQLLCQNSTIGVECDL